MEDKLRNIVDNNKPSSITYDGKKVYISKDKIKEIKELEKQHEGGVLPLLALLPLIFGGIGAAGAAATGIANVVKSAKESQLIDAQKEKLKGSGIYLNPYERRCLVDFFKSKGYIGKLKNGIEVIFDGDGIFLKPWNPKNN